MPTSGLIAYQGIRAQGRVRAGQKVLVNGAGGGVGAFAVQLAKAYGAEVTAVDAAGKLDMLRSIGADRVVDYAHEDFTGSGERYDVILDVPGNRSIADCRRALTAKGTYVLIGHDGFGSSAGRWLGSVGRFREAAGGAPFVSQRMVPREAKDPQDRLLALVELIEAGKLTPVVDRTFPLSEVPAAIRYLRDGSPRGKVVITI